jgi:PAS domain S-box-containing protein
MSLNQQSSWHHNCQRQDILSAKPPRLELVPDIPTEYEIYSQEALRLAQEELLWFRRLYENLPSVYLTLDATGNILSVNEFGAAALGYTAHELKNQPVFNLFAQQEQTRLFEALMYLLNPPTSSPVQASTVQDWEFRLNCPKSKIAWVRVVVSLLARANDNDNLLILMVCEDISTRKRAEEALRESEERFHTIADTAPVMLWMAGVDGKSTFFNQYWLEFTGCTIEQDKDLCWLTALYPEDRSYCLQVYGAAFDARNKFNMEYRLRRADGEYRWILHTGVPRFASNDSFAGYIGCCIDITERKLGENTLLQRQQAAQEQLAEMESLNRLKDEFLSTVSHELRTPLTNMKMAIQMLGIALNKEQNLLEELTNPNQELSKAARYFQILNNECEREIHLINNFLDLQRLDSASEALVMETISLKEWISRAIELFKSRNPNLGQNLYFDVAENLPSILCDPFSLERILIELLTNACKFSPPNSEISVSAQVALNQIQLRVTNSGVEIPEAELPKIFDKFYRIPSNDPWKQGGTGLGLTLVQKIIKSLGGTIKAESASNCTCFTIGLPII